MSSHASATIDPDSIAVVYPSDVAQANRPVDYYFPDGLISFTIENLNPAGGDTVTVVITFPTVFDADAKYYKVTNAGFEAFGDAVINGNQVTLTLTDNGIGDSDAIAGQITDPGGVAVPVATTHNLVNSQPMITAEKLINTTTYLQQGRPKMVALNNGGYVVVWQSYPQDGDQMGIYAQRFDAAGTKQGAEARVNTTTEGTQEMPEIAKLRDGGYVVVWKNPYNNIRGGAGNVYFQQYNFGGVPVGSETLVGVSSGDSRGSYDVAGLSGGDFVVAYTTDDGGESDLGQGSWGIAMQVFDPEGERVVGETIVNTNTYDQQFEPSVAALHDGGYVVAWTSRQSRFPEFSQDDESYGIFSQRFDANGVPVGEQAHVNTTTAGVQKQPFAAALNTGGFIVVWEYDRDVNDYDEPEIYAQLYNSAGEAVGSETQINTSASLGTLGHVSGFSDGGYIVTWSVFLRPSAKSEVYARRFNAAGVPISNAFIVNIRTENEQRRPSVAVLNDDSYVVAWQSSFIDSRFEDIYARRFRTEQSEEIVVTGHENATTTIDILPYAFDQDTDDVLSLYECLRTGDGGSITIVGDRIVFDPGSYYNYLGHGETATVSLLVTVTDDSGESNAVSEPAVVDIIITGTNDLPVVTAAVTASATEDDPQFNVNLLENAADPDGDSLSVIALTLESGDASGVTVGTNALNINPADYSDLNDGESNVIEYSYTVFDGMQGVSQTATITITGTGTGDGPGPDPADIQVNTYTTSDQRAPSVAALSGGGYVVTWRSDGQDGDDDGIYFQRYNADGSELGDETLANTTWEGRQWQSDVSGLTDGGFVITWRDGGDTAADNIYLQRFDASGAKVGSETRVNTTTTNYQSLPEVAGLNDGGYMVIWSSSWDGSYTGVYAQRYDADGNTVGGETRVNTTTENYQTPNAITPLNDGGYLIVWSSEEQDGDNLGIYFQRYDSSGNTVGGETLVNTTTEDVQWGASAAALSGGGYIIAWTSYGQDGDDYGIYHQRYDADGNAVGLETLTNTYTDGQQYEARAAGLSVGGYVVSWRAGGGQDGSGDGVYFQRYDADGNPLGTETLVNTTTTGNQSGASIAAINGGGYVITWETYGQDGDGYGIFLKQFDANGDVVTVP